VRQQREYERVQAADSAVDDDTEMSDDDSSITSLHYADEARSPPHLTREENVQDWVDDQAIGSQAQAEDSYMESIEEDQDPQQFLGSSKNPLDFEMFQKPIL
jgi:hypothetical protein